MTAKLGQDIEKKILETIPLGEHWKYYNGGFNLLKFFVNLPFSTWIQEDMANQRKLLDWWNSWLLIKLLVTSLDRSFIYSHE